MSSFSRRSYKADIVTPILCMIIAVIVLGISIYRPFNKVSDRREVITTVTDKAVKILIMIVSTLSSQRTKTVILKHMRLLIVGLLGG